MSLTLFKPRDYDRLGLLWGIGDGRGQLFGVVLIQHTEEPTYLADNQAPADVADFGRLRKLNGGTGQALI